MTRILLALVLSLGLLLAFVPLVAETQPPGKTAGSGCSRPAAASSRHARYFILQLVESHLTPTLFRQILARIEQLAWHPT